MSTIQVQNINSTDGSTAITTGADGYVSFAKTQIGGRKNILINGNFDVWQRGTSFTSVANNAYTADRFNIGRAGTGGTCNVTRQTFTVGQTDVPNNPKYFYRFSQTVASTDARDKVTQKIEDVTTAAGQTVTLTFWAKADASKEFQIRINQSFGTGGSSPVFTVYDSYTVTTSWQKFEFQLDIPSVAGKTIAGGDDYLHLMFVREASGFSTFDVDIAQVQLEVGTVATPFEHRSYGEELALCQRYYFDTKESTSIMLGNTGAVDPGTTTAVNRLGYQYPVQMRSAPTVSNIDSMSAWDGSTVAPISVVGTTRPGLKSFDVDVTVSSGLTLSRPARFYNASTSTSYITFDAEL